MPGARYADAADTPSYRPCYDFYAPADNLLARAISHPQAPPDAHADRRAELEAVAARSTTKAAIDRYHAAFETGTMNDETAGPRINELRRQNRPNSRPAATDSPTNLPPTRTPAPETVEAVAQPPTPSPEAPPGTK